MLNKLVLLTGLHALCLAVPLAQAQLSSSDESASGLNRYPNVKSANDVIQKWNPNHHLYVKGDLGIGASQLEALESWLDENAPHWTVVLMRQAQDETYTSLDRRRFEGMDAVEFALGRGLALRTNFSEWRDPRTGETDGAVFVLFLDERKFSYYGSVAQDVRRLGEAHWVGELDRPAFRAMRGGGRIIDAVKDTILNINRRLSQKIAAEREQAKREQRAKERTLLNLKTDIAALRESIDVAAAKAAALKQAHPKATGELTSPPTEPWRRRLDGMADSLSEANIGQTTSDFNSLSNEVEGFLNSYAEYDAFEDAVAPIESEIDGLMSNPTIAGQPMAKEATEQLAQARAARQNGNRNLAGFIRAASEAVTRGKQAVADEVERIRRVEARRALIWNTILAMAAVLTLGFIVLLAWLNRRRAPAKDRAHKAFAEREREVKLEMEKIYRLFERCNEILGDKERARKRGYTGTTERLSGNVFEDVDDLFVMSREVERVIDEARDMIHPKQLVGKTANLFSASRYERGVNHISGQPLKFDKSRGLPLVIQRESERTGAEPPDEVTMTFDKVFEAFHDRTATAEQTLDTIEHGLLFVDDHLKQLQKQIEEITALDRDLAKAADDDGLFALPTLFESLIPSAQQDFDMADEVAPADPVRAIQALVPLGLRKTGDALSIAKSVQLGRQNVFPILNENAPRLQELKYDTSWIQEHVQQLGEQANTLLADAVRRNISADADQFSADLKALGERVTRAVELAKSLNETIAPALDELEEKIAVARSKVAADLNLPEEQCLREYNADPSLHLASARKLLAAGQAALQRGGVDAAAQALSELDVEQAAIQSLVDDSLQILGEFDAIRLRRNQHLDDVNDKVPRHAQLLDETARKYASTARRLQAGDSSYEDPAATVETHLEECRDSLADARLLIEQAGEKYRSGLLLEADHVLALAENHIAEADLKLDEIDQHCSKLHEVSQQNVNRLDALRRDADAMSSQIHDRRTMRPTIQEYDGVVDEIQLAQHEINSSLPRDPFLDASTLARFVETIASLKARIASDHDAHAEAARAVAGAKKERSLAEQLVHQARHDGIPDSPATTSNIAAIQAHDAELAQVERELNLEHHDWNAVDQTAARIHSQLGVEAARLRGELERATQLMTVFQSASETVFEATRWNGGFGTRIFGSPGSSELDRARQALNRGNYSAMAELARAAQIAAQQAIQRAQREVQRQQREEARRAEAARRRRRRRNSVSIGGGGFGGISRSSSSRSSSSRSSGSSSGSGFSRSGW